MNQIYNEEWSKYTNDKAISPWRRENQTFDNRVQNFIESRNKSAKRLNTLGNDNLRRSNTAHQLRVNTYIEKKKETLEQLKREANKKEE